MQTDIQRLELKADADLLSEKPTLPNIIVMIIS